LKWGWRLALVLDITLSLAVNLFGGLRTAVAPALGDSGAIAVSASTASVAALLLFAVLARLVKARW
jgi:hypothetical protein